MADPRERELQGDIIGALERDGWLVGDAGRYDRHRAIYPEDVLAFVQQAQRDAWERFSRPAPARDRQGAARQPHHAARRFPQAGPPE